MKKTKTNIHTSSFSAGQKAYLQGIKMQKLFIIWSRLLIFASFLTLWQLSSDFGWIDDFYFSSPIAIGALFLHDITNMSLLQHIAITLMESGLSFLLIILCSLLVATLFWFYPVLGKMFEPFLIVLNSLPKSALAPLIIVWLGTGPRTIILCGMSVGLFGCILNLYQTFQQTDPERLKLIETLGGTRIQAFTKVVFPAPFTPRKAKSSPSFTWKLRLSTASTSLYLFVKFSILIASIFYSFSYCFFSP